MQSEESQSESAPPVPNFDGPLPRPAPTAAYSCKEYNPSISVLCTRKHEVANLELAKLGSGPQILGFDMEWKPNYKKRQPENPVALVQLSNHNTVFLLQISAMEEFPSQLAQVLANPSIVKAGVGIQYDAQKLYRDYRVPIFSCVDLSLLTRTVDARWKGRYIYPLGLSHLIETYEYRLLVKDKLIACSNWEVVLEKPQIEYASNDAHAGYILCNKLVSMIPSLQEPPEAVWYSFNCVAGCLTDANGLPWSPVNPNYDPGPTFPLKVLEAPKISSAADIIEGGGAVTVLGITTRTSGGKPIDIEQDSYDAP